MNEYDQAILYKYDNKQSMAMADECEGVYSLSDSAKVLCGKVD